MKENNRLQIIRDQLESVVNMKRCYGHRLLAESSISKQVSIVSIAQEHLKLINSFTETRAVSE